LGDKLAGAPGGHVIDESNVVGMLFSNKNQLSSHDTFGVSSIDVSQIVQTNVQALDGATDGSQRKMPKDVHMPTKDEVITFGGIAPTMARSSVRLQCKDNADDEVMDKAVKLAQQRMDPMVTGTKKIFQSLFY
jgi:hypothetical protein